MRILLGLIGLATILGFTWAQLTREERREGFRPLLNGKDLRGWKVYAGPDWRIESREKEILLVGPTQGAGWIGTEAEYDNFILRGEYWIDKGETHESNSGIFIRAQRTATPWIDGYEIQISLQDPNNPTGSIYGRVPTHLERMREIAPEKQWNRFEIRACGSRIQVVINGEMVQDADLHEFSKGVIGFQQHHPGVTVRFRNLRIKPLKASECDEGWQPLFNGKDLTGWFATGLARWEVRAGLSSPTQQAKIFSLTQTGKFSFPTQQGTPEKKILGTSEEKFRSAPEKEIIEGVLVGQGGMGHLFTERTFRDFELRAMIRIRPYKDDSPFKPNSGIYFRAKPNPENPNNWPIGYEAQVYNHMEAQPFTGSLYNRARASRLLTRDGAWFSMRIVAKGDHIQIFVNGQKVVDARDSEFREGHIAIQCHDPFTIIEIRDIYWRAVREK